MSSLIACLIASAILLCVEFLTSTLIPIWVWFLLCGWWVVEVALRAKLKPLEPRNTSVQLRLQYPVKFDVTFRVKWKPLTQVLDDLAETAMITHLTEDVRSYVVAWGVGATNWTHIYDQMTGLKNRLNKDADERNAEVLDIRIINIENAPPVPPPPPKTPPPPEGIDLGEII